MSWQIIVYTRITDEIDEVLNLGQNDGVPDRVFNKVKENSQLDAYFHYIRTDDAIRWGYWIAKENRWDQVDQIPNQVKLVGVLAE